MRILPVAILIIGTILFFAGIVLAIAAPATATWEPKSEILAIEKPLTVSAGWTSESDNLIDEVITVDLYETYDYGYAWPPFILEEAKDFVITGTAVEQSSPQRWFNFYVFEGVNFDLWKAGSTYTAYYKAEGKTSVSFTFSIASENDVPDTFYFVVEEYNVAVKPTVRVTATISWAEKASIYDCSDYFTSWSEELILTYEQVKDFVLNGSATEVGNNKFNFYIFDSDNYFDWIGGESYTAYYEKKNVTTASFSIPLTEAPSGFYFVAENPLLDTSETVKVSATLEWQEKATIATTIGGIILGGIVAFIGFIVIIIGGIAALISKPKPPAPPTRMCPKCGMMLSPDLKFCPYCGKALREATHQKTDLT